jgi:hypothetical protein
VSTVRRTRFSGLSLTFPRLLSRLFSHSKSPFSTSRNLPKLRPLASDYPLYFAFVGYRLRNRYKWAITCHHVSGTDRVVCARLHSNPNLNSDEHLVQLSSYPRIELRRFSFSLPGLPIQVIRENSEMYPHSAGALRHSVAGTVLEMSDERST